jgi:hypothetical protein
MHVSAEAMTAGRMLFFGTIRCIDPTERNGTKRNETKRNETKRMISFLVLVITIGISLF